MGGNNAKENNIGNFIGNTYWGGGERGGGVSLVFINNK